jgi:hypothetical protein
MKKPVAKKVQICIFWKEPLNYDSIANWPTDVRAIWEAFASVILDLRQKHGASVPIEMYVCPITITQNAVIIAHYNLDPSNLPAAQLFSEYSDGTTGEFFLKKDIDDRFFFGVNWKASDVRPYVESLLYRLKPSDESLICKMFPPLCKVGVYAWAAVIAVSAYKSVKEDGLEKIAWLTLLGLSFDSFSKKGGFEHLKQKLLNK